MAHAHHGHMCTVGAVLVSGRLAAANPGGHLVDLAHPGRGATPRVGYEGQVKRVGQRRRRARQACRRPRLRERRPGGPGHLAPSGPEAPQAAVGREQAEPREEGHGLGLRAPVGLRPAAYLPAAQLANEHERIRERSRTPAVRSRTFVVEPLLSAPRTIR